MPTLKFYLDDIRRIANRAGDIKATSRLEERQLIFWLNDYRAAFIMQDYIAQLTAQGGRKTIYPVVDQHLFQDMGCLSLTCVDKAECSTLEWGCPILKVSIPNYVSLPGDAGLFVGLIDKQQRFTRIESWEVANKLASPFAKLKNYYYTISNKTGNDLYIVAAKSPDLKYADVKMIALDPREICTIKKGQTTCCYNFEADEYPISSFSNMGRKLLESVLTKELGIAYQFKGDLVNDQKDDS